MASLAARDQENIINAHQQAAVAKPLNQSVRGLQPKTPGNKNSQTPFRGKLHDENAAQTIKGGKTGAGKNGAKENIQLTLGGKGKQAALTPAPQTQARNALAPKTTNAKAKAAQTPGPAGAKQEVAPKTNQRPASLRKNKTPRNELSQTTKLQIPVDLEDCPSPEIEAMYPRPPDMEDLDDDFPPLDLSIFDPSQGGIDADKLPAMIAYERAHAKGPDGLSFLERHAKREAEREDILERRMDAAMLRQAECHLLPCYHDPECDEGECKDWPEQLRQAEEKYNATMKELVLPEERLAKQKAAPQKTVKTARPRSTTSTVRARVPTTGPSDLASKRAATALSMRPKTPAASSENSRPSSRGYEKPWLAGAKGPAPDGHAARHAAAVAASKTTLGFRKGRTASANINKRVVLPKDEQGRTIGSKPKRGEDKKDLEVLQGMFEERQAREAGVPVGTGDRDILDEQAEQDFVLSL